MDTLHAFPHVWQNSNSSNNSLPLRLKEDYDNIKSKLLQCGAVLFKSYGIEGMAKLEDCVNAFPGEPLDYIDGNSPRTKLQGKVYTSTEFPAEAFISLHNELSYSKKWPRHLFFCCVTPAQEGGSTSIADSRNILKKLSPEIVETFKTKGVQYIRNLHSGNGIGPSWMDTFETEDKHTVERHCEENDVLYKWDSRDNLRLIQNRTATIQHPETGEEVWFNQADQFHPSTNSKDVYEALVGLYEDDLHAMPQYACFQDGTEIPVEMLDEIRSVTKDVTVNFTWEKGDLMIVDNVLAAHGRTPFKGPRKILVSMSA